MSGSAVPDLEVTQLDLQVDRSPGSLLGLGTGGTVSYKVKNVGNVRLIPNVKIHVTSSFGLTDRRVEAQLQELLPGQSQVVRQAVDDLRPVGRLRASLTVTAQTATATRSTTVWAIPWLLLAIVALVAGGLLLWASRRRQQAGEPTDPDPDPDPDPAGPILQGAAHEIG